MMNSYAKLHKNTIIPTGCDVSRSYSLNGSTTVYDPEIHHRRSIRMKGFDYSQPGLYFITICVHNKLCLFGNVIDGEMCLNKLGRIVEQEWLNTINVRKNDVALHEYVVMPNHFHAVIELTNRMVVNDKGVCDTPLRCSPSKTIGAIVRGFKGAVSKNIGRSIWQRNYYEHIIRNAHSYRLIIEYIINNPVRWEKDTFYIV